MLGNANLYGLLSIAMMIPMFLSLLFASKLVQKLGMRKTGVLSAILFSAGSALTILGGKALPLLMAGIVVRSLGMGPISTLIFAMIAEVADNIRMTGKVAVEGMVYSCSSIGIKVGSGVGTAIVGWLLEFGGYDGKLAVQSASALHMISVSYLVLPLIIGLVMILLFACMNVENVNKELRAHAQPVSAQ